MAVRNSAQIGDTVTTTAAQFVSNPARYGDIAEAMARVGHGPHDIAQLCGQYAMVTGDDFDGSDLTTAIERALRS